MRLTPKITSPVNAIKLKSDVIAERGQWLLIMDNDEIKVMDDAEVRASFNIEQPISSYAPAHKPTRVNGVPRTVYSATIDGKTINVAGQLARTLLAADKLTRSGRTRFQTNALYQFLTGPDVAQVSARIFDATKREWIAEVGITSNGKIWQLTEKGTALARALTVS